MENKQVTKEELEKLKEIQNENDNSVIELGRVGYQMAILKEQKRQIEQNILALQIKESEFSKELVKKYGNINVDLETGTIS